MIFNKLGTFEGSPIFIPRDFKEVFRDHTLKFAIRPDDSEDERGVSMAETRNDALRLDLRECPWYAYDDCFGTSEEKALIKYVESIMDKLKEKYDEIFLVRNEFDLKIYSFDDGAAFEPDFVLFLRHKGDDRIFDNIQLFIEPKGRHLEAQDKWKEEFLQRINTEERLVFGSHSDNYRIIGLPFFQNGRKQKFSMALSSGIDLELV